MTSYYSSDVQEQDKSEAISSDTRPLSQTNALEPLNHSLSNLKAQFLEWMKRKSNNLYPSRQDKLQIAKELGTSLDQINRLLANHRRRQLKNQSKKLQNTQQQTLLASPSFANDKENRQQQFPFGPDERQRDKRIEQTIDDIICKELFGHQGENQMQSYSATPLKPADRQQRANAPTRRGRGPGKAKLAASQQNNTGVFSHQWSNNRQMSSSEEETFKQLFARATESTPTHQVVPDLTRNMLMTSPESSNYFQPQQQQQFNMVHQSDQYNNNLAALIGTLAQHQQLQSQQQQQTLPPQTAYFPLQATPMAASQLPENTLSALIAKQQEAATVNSQNYSAANILASQQAMQIAIQKELQILYQRHYLQQIMQQQQQLAQNSNASLLSPPLSSSDQTDQSTGYATSCSPYSMSNSSSSLCSSNASNENSNSSNPTIYSQQDSAQPPYNRTLTEKRAWL